MRRAREPAPAHYYSARACVCHLVARRQASASFKSPTTAFLACTTTDRPARASVWLCATFEHLISLHAYVHYCRCCCCCCCCKACLHLPARVYLEPTCACISSASRRIASHRIRRIASDASQPASQPARPPATQRNATHRTRVATFVAVAVFQHGATDVRISQWTATMGPEQCCSAHLTTQSTSTSAMVATTTAKWTVSAPADESGKLHLNN